MSYDLLSFKCPAGVDPGDAYDELMQAEDARQDSGVTEPPATPAMVTFVRQLQAAVPDLADARPAAYNGGIELTGQALSVAVSPASTEVNVPYWGRLDGSHFVDDLVQFVSCARAAGHDTLFDPQLDRAVDPIADRRALIEMFEEGLAIVAELSVEDQPVALESVPSAAPDAEPVTPATAPTPAATPEATDVAAATVPEASDDLAATAPTAESAADEPDLPAETPPPGPTDTSFFKRLFGSRQHD